MVAKFQTTANQFSLEALPELHQVSFRFDAVKTLAQIQRGPIAPIDLSNKSSIPQLQDVSFKEKRPNQSPIVEPTPRPTMDPQNKNTNQQGPVAPPAINSLIKLVNNLVIPIPHLGLAQTATPLGELRFHPSKDGKEILATIKQGELTFERKVEVIYDKEGKISAFRCNPPLKIEGIGEALIGMQLLKAVELSSIHSHGDIKLNTSGLTLEPVGGPLKGCKLNAQYDPKGGMIFKGELPVEGVGNATVEWKTGTSPKLTFTSGALQGSEFNFDKGTGIFIAHGGKTKLELCPSAATPEGKEGQFTFFKKPAVKLTTEVDGFTFEYKGTFKKENDTNTELQTFTIKDPKGYTSGNLILKNGVFEELKVSSKQLGSMTFHHNGSGSPFAAAAAALAPAQVQGPALHENIIMLNLLRLGGNAKDIAVNFDPKTGQILSASGTILLGKDGAKQEKTVTVNYNAEEKKYSLQLQIPDNKNSTKDIPLTLTLSQVDGRMSVDLKALYGNQVFTGKYDPKTNSISFTGQKGQDSFSIQFEKNKLKSFTCVKSNGDRTSIAFSCDPLEKKAALKVTVKF